MCPDPETFCKEESVDFAEFSQLPEVKDELDTIEYLKKKAQDLKKKAEAEAQDQYVQQLQLDEYRKQFPELTDEEIRYAMSLDQFQQQ